MSQGSTARRLRRMTMKAKGVTFAQRLNDAIRLKQPVRQIRWNVEAPKKEQAS